MARAVTHQLWKPSPYFRGGWRVVGVLKTDGQGRSRLPWGLPGKILVRPRGTARPLQEYIHEPGSRALRLVWDPGTRVEGYLKGLPWELKLLEVELVPVQGVKGGRRLRPRNRSGPLSWDRVPAGTWRVEVKTGPGSGGSWTLPLANALVRVPGGGRPVRVESHYAGPPLAWVAGSVKSGSGKQLPASLRLRSAASTWRLKVDGYGKVEPGRVPVGVYSLVWLRGEAVAPVRGMFQVGPEGVALAEELVLCRAEVLCRPARGGSTRNLDVRGQVTDARGRLLWGGPLRIRQGRILLQGSPGLCWQLRIQGPIPGAAKSVEVVLEPGRVVRREVRLPW